MELNTSLLCAMRFYILLIQLNFFALSFNTCANAKKDLEQTFAAALVLTDGDSITLGYGNFNPTKLLSPHHEDLNENEDSLDLRKQLSLYSIPFDFTLDQTIWGHKATLHNQVSYLKQSRDISIFTREPTDFSDEKMYSATIGLSIEEPISSKWFYRARISSHLMHYENEYDFNSYQSKQQLKPLIEGTYANLQSNTLIFNPNASVIYRLPRAWGHYEYKLKFNYYYGWALSQPNLVNTINPESWQTSNGIKANFNMFKVFDSQQSFYVKAQRIDLGADSREPLNTDHFYEYGLGVLWDVSRWTDWFNNFGIGVNINNGSSLDGGTIVIYFNEI